MPKDFKTGLFAGVVLVAAVSVWLASRSSLSLESKKPEKQQLLRNDTDGLSGWPEPLPSLSNSQKKPHTVPPPLTQSSLQLKQTLYEVKKGDTFSGIAQNLGIETRKLRNANRDIVKDINNIRPGTRLRIPD